MASICRQDDLIPDAHGCVSQPLGATPVQRMNPTAWLTALWNGIVRRVSRARSVEPARTLSQVDDPVLHDIGFTKPGVDWAGRQPTSTDAAVALHTLSLQRPTRR